MDSSLIFRPGRVEPRAIPLGRYLPRLPIGAASGWLRDNLAPGAWVIDPYGASPQLAVEAARAGYRILVAANNPISRFMIEMAATPPSEGEMRAALADLAASKRGEERLEPHIRSLYTTHCDHCGQEVDAIAFLWERESPAPYAREYACPHCQHAGEFPVTEADIQKATQFQEGGPHLARALERVASSHDPLRPYAEEALEAYLPRAVYALFTLINKMEGLTQSEAQQDMLIALMLTACDRANTLWNIPSARARPRQLTIPPKFREHNIWLALEDAIQLWSSSQAAARLTVWPDLPPETGGICLFEGPVRELASQLEGIDLKAVISALPRQNQAFWTLSALWAGWLWGRDAGGMFTRVLARRRFDWAWHTTALENSLSHLVPLLEPDTPYFGLVTESEPGFDAAAMVAAELAGFSLEGVAVRQKAGQTQCLWRKKTGTGTKTGKDPAAMVKATAQSLLEQRGEPAPYLPLQAAALQALAAQGAIAAEEQPPGEVYSHIRSQIEVGLTYRSGFHRFEASEHTIEIGKWWPRKTGEVQPPLGDRVEIALVNDLLENPDSSYYQIDASVCAAFPGLETPEEGLVRALLDSYAVPDNEGRWQLRSSDAPKTRQEDIREIGEILSEVGERLGYRISNGQLHTWEPDGKGSPIHFHLIASAVIGKIILTPDHPAKNSLIVLPGGRSRLVLYKLDRDPRLKNLVENGWRFLKFRAVRRMRENPSLTLETLASHLTLDPITHDDPQMPLL